MKFTRVSVLVALLVAVCLPAGAQVIETRMGVNVPFNFVAGSEYLPAGHYTIVQASSDTNTIWRITSDNDRVSVSIVTSNTSSPVKSHHRSVVFQQVGTRYVLSEFWTTEHSGRELPKAHHQTLEASTAKNVEIAAE